MKTVIRPLSFFCLFALSLSAGTTPSPDSLIKELESLRTQLTQANQALSENERIREDAAKKDANLPEDVRLKNKQNRVSDSGWLALFQNQKKVYEKYLTLLVKTFIIFPSSDQRFKEIQKELNQQHPENCKNSLTVSWHDQHSLLAKKIYPYLINPQIEKEKAEFFAILTKPSAGTKFEDFLHFVGLGAEPQNWHVQNTYSLASLRIGNVSNARSENKKLIRKATKYSRFNEPENQFNLRTRKELREYKLLRALIEATEGKKKEALRFQSEAMQIAPNHPPRKELQRIIDETQGSLGNW